MRYSLLLMISYGLGFDLSIPSFFPSSRYFSVMDSGIRITGMMRVNHIKVSISFVRETGFYLRRAFLLLRTKDGMWMMDFEFVYIPKFDIFFPSEAKINRRVQISYTPSKGLEPLWCVFKGACVSVSWYSELTWFCCPAGYAPYRYLASLVSRVD